MAAPPPPRSRVSTRALLIAVAAALTGLLACSKPASHPSIDTTANASTHLPGKFVWRALMTDNVAASRSFYGDLLGWTFEDTAAEGYTLIRSGGRPVGAIIEVPDQGMRDTQWLSFLSVADVDAAAAAFETSGTIFREPFDIPGFGRVAIVADPLGAPVALVHSESGDPPDGREPRTGEFLWTEYVAPDPAGVRDHYAGIVDWEVREERPGYWVLFSGGRGRAGAFENPWAQVRPNWLPYVRVADTGAKVAEAKRLGGQIVVDTSSAIRNGTTAIVLDPRGGALALQSYPF